MKYAAGIGSAAVIYIPSFIMVGLGIQRLMERIHRHKGLRKFSLHENLVAITHKNDISLPIGTMVTSTSGNPKIEGPWLPFAQTDSTDISRVCCKSAVITWQPGLISASSVFCYNASFILSDLINCALGLAPGKLYSPSLVDLLASLISTASQEFHYLTKTM
jgi:hypothetical protein